MTKLQKKTYEQMVVEVQQMTKEELTKNLRLLGCKLGYTEINNKLKGVWNDLAVADELFSVYHIDDTNSCYTKEFVDEAVLYIATHEIYSFQHYGIISTKIRELRHDPLQYEACYEAYLALISLAQQFQLHSLEWMVYYVNDGVDLIGACIELLDRMMEAGRRQPIWLTHVVSFIHTYLQVFDQTNDLLSVCLQYEMAKAYIGLHDARGDQIFKKLLKKHFDKTDVVLHYMLAYLDDDRQKVRKIYQQYHALITNKSDSYSIIQDVMSEFKK